jgi:ABC-2 type transport system ATP-binding protein
MLLTTHDLADIEELCRRLLVIDKGKLLFDGPLAELKRRLWREHTIKFDLRDRDQALKLEALASDNLTVERLSDLSVRLRFPREAYTTAEIIRRVVTSAEVLDIAIEEQPIDEVVKEIYSGNLLQEPVR